MARGRTVTERRAAEGRAIADRRAAAGFVPTPPPACPQCGSPRWVERQRTGFLCANPAEPHGPRQFTTTGDTAQEGQ